MAKGGKKQQAAQYESGTLAAYAVAGIVLMGLGVLSLLSVVGGLKGVFFSQVRRVMQGLGGGLCIGVSVLLIWAGLLTAISTGRHMPKKALLLVTALYVAVLSVILLFISAAVLRRLDISAIPRQRSDTAMANKMDSLQRISTVSMNV